MANIPPLRSEFSDEVDYQMAYDQWAYDITQEMNTAAAGSADAEMDNQGRVVINNVSVGYRFRYLDTAYGSDNNGADFSQTVAGLPQNTSPIYQGVRNVATASSSTNPVEFTWREVNNTMNSQDLVAGYRLIGGRDLDWSFDANLPANYTEDSGPPIDLENFAAGEQGPEGDPALTVFLSITSGNVFRNQAGPDKTISCLLYTSPSPRDS